jgi:hypothetical protein
VTPAVRPVLASRGGDAGYLRFPLLTARGMQGFPSPKHAGRLGITPGYPAPLATLAAVQARLVRGAGPRRWPGAASLCERLVALPTHSYIRPREMREILRLVAVYRS